MSVYVTDTHPLIWYASRTHRQLSHRALRAFEQAENGEVFILVPAPVLWEVSILDKVGHITLSKPFEQWLRDLLQKPCYDQIPLDAEIRLSVFHLYIIRSRNASNSYGLRPQCLMENDQMIAAPHLFSPSLVNLW